MRWLRNAFGPDEIAIVLALALVALGCWQCWRPGAALVPGLVLLWLFLPQRSSFFSRPPTVPAPKVSRRVN